MLSKNSNFRVAYLRGQIDSETAFTHYFPEKLFAEIFGEENLIPLSAQDLRFSELNEQLQGVNLLFLSGITGENSPYPEILKPERAKQIRWWARKTGAILWFECAAAYYLFENIEYSSPNGFEKSTQGLGWIKGKARGTHPMQSCALKSEFQQNSSPLCFDSVIPVNIEMKKPSPLKSSFSVAYSYSPLLFPEPNQVGLQILAYYKDIFDENGQQAVALANLSTGSSEKIIVGGVLPTIRPEFLPNTENPSLSFLKSSLEDSADAHKIMWHAIIRTLRRPHLKYNTQIQKLCGMDWN